MPHAHARYVVKVGNRTSEWPDLTRAFHTQSRAKCHADRLRQKGFATRIVLVEPKDNVFVGVPHGDHERPRLLRAA